MYFDLGRKSKQNRWPDRRTTQEGYTLVELLVVLVIIGLIAALVAPRVLGYLSTAKTETARIQIKNIKDALELYYLDLGKYPTKDEGLVALAAKPADEPAWKGPYLKGADALKDPWGNAYLYSPPADGADANVISLGRDGKVGGDGDDKDLP